MNGRRIQAAIELMKQAENLDMTDWQGPSKPFVENVAESVEELHACGNTACFGGYLALLPEWREAGGSAVTSTGCPVFNGYRGETAIMEYFECQSAEEIRLVMGIVYGDRCDQWSNFYNKLWEKVEPQDVIEKLEKLLALSDD